MANAQDELNLAKYSTANIMITCIICWLHDYMICTRKNVKKMILRAVRARTHNFL